MADKYGVVYTPDSLASFVASLLRRFINEDDINRGLNVLDPASGGGALLRAAQQSFGDCSRYYGIDVDEDAATNTNSIFSIIHNDTVLPEKCNLLTESYWKRELPVIDAIIANPPWSSEKIYNKEKLLKAGYTMISGQYDSYVLFIELAYKLLRDDGVMAFIIPDSLFDSQNEELRRFLSTHMQIKVIARLGEKIFADINRSTVVIVLKKALPSDNTITECFRLDSTARKEYLEGKRPLDELYNEKVHCVKQMRFARNNYCQFDIDTREDEERVVNTISTNVINWNNVFSFGRGVEISKSGKTVCCPYCGASQGYSKKQLESGSKECANCQKRIPINSSTIKEIIHKDKKRASVKLLAGENVSRYSLHGASYLERGIKGIDYKTIELFDSPKLLVRKTGLGIYGAIDYSGAFTTQTVYILRLVDNTDVPLEYYLALLNSRIVYYYYLKKYGENEWKSHPYLTKQILFSLPIRPYEGSALDEEIVSISKTLIKNYDRNTDLRLESLIMKKYGLNKDDQRIIATELNSLPNLGAINDMKMGVVS